MAPQLRPSLFAAFRDLRNALQYVTTAGYQQIDDALKRFVHTLESTEPFETDLLSSLPDVDFDTWYAAALATKGGIVGSGKLKWPLGMADRVALQRELLTRISADQIDLLDFARAFTYVDKYPDSNVDAFVKLIVVPFFNDLISLCRPILEAEEADQEAAPARTPIPWAFIDPVRLDALRSTTSASFDLSRLIRLCEEIDTSFENECYFAVAALTRALLDHVPPIFGVQTFGAVVNNYSGSKSFKDSIRHLESSARKIGDAHLHTQIRARESLPTATQVNFSNDLDVLLAEITRILS